MSGEILPRRNFFNFILKKRAYLHLQKKNFLSQTKTSINLTQNVRDSFLAAVLFILGRTQGT